MTIVMESEALDARKVEAHLYKLVNVIDVQELTNQPSVTRDLALIKVKPCPSSGQKSPTWLRSSAARSSMSPPIR